ncbi:Phosphocarrier protein HPr /phosphoenolpyruvate--protein phosphotransferase /PTS system IIA component, Glc family [Chromohalobacter canadensis]|uniref:phosphoenolpyruvate--protein phosphotransferase n=1 Tax=Chromohalobacter canadensis TaxID=141389 RepID=A0A285VKU0_9GAMM|nr:phosphoenolpyruvate--protein phosphotransferase [Chromohalobacter canadensis]SOC54168.1 Phosphocarrier protein HPr /phosphoenolpyruvate--protein phosphotransferase /PTS system IIA component, Glc family [Chromohalobacter canadensis]
MASSLDIKAPVDGVLVALDAVPDPVFAGGTLGEGLAIDPLGDTLHAPCDGEIVHCARTAHAVTLRSTGGVELLVHLGLDTVNLDGAGIELLVEAGQWVEAGEPLLRFDADQVAQQAMSLITPLIIAEPSGWRLTSLDTQKSGETARQGEVIMRLEAPAASPNVAPESDEASPRQTQEMTRDVILALAAGLHARPTARLRAIAHEQNVDLELVHDETHIDARSLSRLMNMGLVEGDRVTLIARGKCATTALDAAERLLSEAEADEPVASAAEVPTAEAGAGQLAGLVASQGLVVGPLHHYVAALPTVPQAGDDPAHERAALGEALEKVGHSLKTALAQAKRGARSSEAEILEAHLAWLDDPALREAAEGYIDSGRSAGQAWKEALDDEAAGLQATGNKLLAARVADLRDLQRQVMACLGTAPSIPQVPAGAIVIADDLTPSELTALAAQRPAGICLVAGGTTSHVAILARARGLPCLVAMGTVLESAEGDMAILDAERGLLEPQPDIASLETMRKRIAESERARDADRESAKQPATTRDGRTIEVCANVAGGAEATLAAQDGADGIGLLRSEFLFLDRESAPSVDEQRGEYQAALDALGGKPVVVRTLDIGADKQLSYLPLPSVANPALGVRGIRLWASHAELLESQLRALLALQPLDALRIMLPMVSGVGELRALRQRLETLAGELGVSRLPQLGVMIEVPSAALCAASLAAEADFLSIGTNDLTQYTLAMDREDPGLAAQLDVLHPAVLRLIKTTVDGAAGRCPVGVCGAAAGDPLALAVLVALGVDELSVEPSRVPAVKASLRELDAGALAEQLSAWSDLDDGAMVRERLKSWLKAPVVA